MPDRSGRIFLAMVLIISGLFFSAVMYWPGMFRAETWWPAFVLVPGLAMLTGAFAGMIGGGRSTVGLAIPGCIVTTIGGMLLYSNVTGRWESWAYIWTLIPASVGLGLVIVSRFGIGGAGAAKTGFWMMTFSLLGLLFFGAFFEGFIFGGLLSRWWPLSLILLGGIVLLTNRPRRGD